MVTWIGQHGFVENYYRKLQIPANASQQDVKNAFRRTSKYFHPDRVPNEQVAAKKWATDKFKELGEAFEVLSNPGMRERYDEDLFGSRQNARFVRSASWHDLSTELPVRQFVLHLDLLEKGFRFDVIAEFMAKAHRTDSGLDLLAANFIATRLVKYQMGLDFEFWMKVADATRAKIDYDGIVSEMNSALDRLIRDWSGMNGYTLFTIALDDQYPEEMRAKAREALASDGKWATKCLEAANP